MSMCMSSPGRPSRATRSTLPVLFRFQITNVQVVPAEVPFDAMSKLRVVTHNVIEIRLRERSNVSDFRYDNCSCTAGLPGTKIVKLKSSSLRECWQCHHVEQVPVSVSPPVQARFLRSTPQAPALSHTEAPARARTNRARVD